MSELEVTINLAPKPDFPDGDRTQLAGQGHLVTGSGAGIFQSRQSVALLAILREILTAGGLSAQNFTTSHSGAITRFTMSGRVAWLSGAMHFCR